MVPKLRIRISESSGVTILLTGIALLVVTFLVACVHLYGELSVSPVLGFASPVGDLLSIFLAIIDSASIFVHYGLGSNYCDSQRIIHSATY